jgi:Penicillin-Binding Protein C-terminus Family
MHAALAQHLTPELEQTCLRLAASEGRLTDLGLDFYDWARNEGLAKEPWLAALCTGAATTSEVKVLHPSSGDVFLVMADLPLADQAIPLRVRAAPSHGVLRVRIDGQVVTSLSPPYTGRVPVTAGAHQLDLADDSGAILDSVRYVVRR